VKPGAQARGEASAEFGDCHPLVILENSMDFLSGATSLIRDYRSPIDPVEDFV
jgi:hypothetical protein